MFFVGLSKLYQLVKRTSAGKKTFFKHFDKHFLFLRDIFFRYLQKIFVKCDKIAYCKSKGKVWGNYIYWNFFRKFSRLSSKSLLIFGWKQTGRVVKTELYRSREILKNYSILKKKQSSIQYLRNFFPKMADIYRQCQQNRFLQVQWKILRKKSISKLKLHACFPLGSKSYRKSGKKFSVRLWRLTVILSVQRIFFEKSFFSKKPL